VIGWKAAAPRGDVMVSQNGYRNAGYVPYQPGFEGKDHYRSFIVPEGHPLHGIVSDFYQFDASSSEGEVCVIPDGCFDLLFRYDEKGASKTIEGYHLKKVVIPINQVGSAFGVRFVPGGLSGIIKAQTSELIGAHVPMTDFLKRDHLLDQMEVVADFSRRIEIMSEYLCRRIERRYGPEDVVRYCTEKIIRSQGNVQVRDLSEETGYTIRYLRNLYHRHVGISPKELCEIIQFQASFAEFSQMNHENKFISLSDFAVLAGYYDQSHMNKCYRKMVGSLPQKFYVEMLPVVK
jgi:AraC-like DNA-binding protein